MGDHAARGCGAAGPFEVAMADPAPEVLERGRVLFAGDCSFRAAAATVEQLPAADLPEVAFAGRSNVGKSSLLNSLVGRKALARTSQSPGRTRQITFYDLGGRLRLVDLPGYGYAKAPKHAVRAWTRAIEEYLRGRPNLRRALLLVDLRAGWKESDEAALLLLDQAAVPTRLVLTKTDKMNTGALTDTVAEVARRLKSHPCALPEPAVTSAREGTGVATLRAELAELATG